MTSKRRAVFVFCFLFVLSAFSIECDNALADNAKYTLRAATYSSGKTGDSKCMEEWAKLVNEKSGGQIKIDIYWSEALGKTKDLFKMLDSGICDIGYGGYPHFPGKFPVTDVIGLPYLVTNTYAVGDLLNGLLHDGLLEEWNKLNVKLISFLPTDPTLMFFREKKVTTLEELKGMKIRAPGKANLAIVEALGAIPTAISTTDLYMSLDRGVIDGLCTSAGYYYPHRLYEVTKYALLEPIGEGMNFVVMSNKAWKKLPPDLQVVIEETSKAYFFKNATMQVDNFVNKSIPGIKEAGIEVYTLTEAERAKWYKATENLVNEWVKSMKEKGLPGEEAVKRAMDLRAATR